MSTSPVQENNRPPHPLESSLPEVLRAGDADQFSFAIESISVEDGHDLSLPSPGVTAIVGGNNVGKSTLLRQIYELLPKQVTGSPSFLLAQPPVLRGITLRKDGLPRDLTAWLLQHAVLSQPDPDVAGSAYVISKAGATSLNPASIEHAWMWQLDTLATHLVYSADARSRHEWTRPAARRPNIDLPPTHPMHVFQENHSIVDELSKICQEAFDSPLTVDPVSGDLFFRVGEPDLPAPPVDKMTTEYTDSLRKLPPLAQQGDGMVFMMGALIPIIAATFPVILVDEPEAFLHPPQAFLMGQALARLSAQRGLQILVATHDRNILRGLLDVTTADVAIARLTRDQDHTSARLLSVDDVRKISTDAVLRYTNILDGLFHQLVVLAENERDCRFYQAALEHLDGREKLPIAPHDVLFIPTNGKGNMAAIADVLKDTGVRVVASPDLDLLNNRTVVSKLFTAVGGEWDPHLDRLYTRATNQFQAPPTKRLNKDVRISVLGVLDEDLDAVFDSERSRRVSTALKVANPWDALKQQGVPAMNADREATRELIGLLDTAGVITVEVGELENFDSYASRSSKDAWLKEALERGAHTTEPVASHIRRLLGAPQT